MVKNNQSGLTLIEILMVLLVSGILAVGSLSSYKSFNERKTLEAEANKFIETLEVAKKRTSVGQKPCLAYSGSYSVSWTNTDYTLTPLGCSGGDIVTYNLPGSVDMNETTGSITYKPFGLGITSGTSVCALMRNVNSDVCKQITIETGGTITEDDNADCVCI